jgi:NADH:ubiquinone oxidoreductase subunit 5 (subunit L)/multisubunit Na+/H+ antiporter MnhA subunit
MAPWLPVAIWCIPLLIAVLTALVPWGAAALAHRVAATGMAVATGLAGWMAVLSLHSGEAFSGPHATWLDLGSFTLGVGVYVDPMGAVMALIVCLLSTLVLVFNAWYMHGDRLAARYPWQFCFFVFAMLGVVLSDNLFLSFCCWELVGLGSYLLIGFWFDKPAASDDPEYQANKGKDARGVLEHLLSPAHAQLKAFVMNRVGDAGFLIGIGVLLWLSLWLGHNGDVLGWSSLHGLPADTVRFADKSNFDTASLLLLIGALGIFCGAVGKSAQFPLHPWLPDAMQGPTTASSIIHAATMVAAGVFLVARCYPMFPPEALAVVGWTGGITCLLAASIACVQWDLKAVLAYSTVSQLGLMFVGLGAGPEAGGRAAGISHLFTHAFFKCLLFLCAGAVIHAAAGCQDLHRMGGLRRKMPVTAWCSLAAVLAIAGAPFFSGFYSKDAVLAAALHRAWHPVASPDWSDQLLVWGPLVLAAAGSLLTSAYMLRWWFRIFAGDERDHELLHHAHDPSPSARYVLLAFAPFTLSLPWTLGSWLDTALQLPHSDELHHAHTTAMVLAASLLAGGAAFALVVYWWAPRNGRDLASPLAKVLRPLHTLCSELWFFDKLWDLVFTRGLGRGLAAVTARLDLGSQQRLRDLENNASTSAAGGASGATSLDGMIDGIGRTCGSLGRAGSLLHGGRVGAYLAVASILGAAGLLWGLLR